jgi:hypothetical protein
MSKCLRFITKNHCFCFQLWESAIRVCKTLIHEYETEAFDFIKLSEMLVRYLMSKSSLIIIF